MEVLLCFGFLTTVLVCKTVRQKVDSSILQDICGATVFRGGFHFCGKYQHSVWCESRSLFLFFMCLEMFSEEYQMFSKIVHCQQPF